MKPRIGSLFSGGGFLDLAVLQVFAGEIVWHSQYEPPDKDGKEKRQFAAEVLDYRWPGIPNLGDITAVDWASVDPVDILTGGFPCQDISNAGLRAGIEGERSGLWSYMADAIGHLRPSYVVVENVAALLGRGMGRVVSDLGLLGYDCQWQMVKASDVGAPHRRARIFLLGSRRERCVCGGIGGRRGLHRDRDSWGLSKPAIEGGNDRQGPTFDENAGEALRRDDLLRTPIRSQASRCVCLANEWPACGRGDREARAIPADESRGSENRAAVRDDAACSTAREAARHHVDARDDGEGEHTHQEDSARKSAWAGCSGAGSPVRLEDDRPVSLGCLVGTGREPVRASGVRRCLAGLGENGCWPRVRGSAVAIGRPRHSSSDPSRAGLERAWAGGNGSEFPESLGCGGTAPDAGGTSRRSLGHAESGNGAGSDGFGATEPRGCGSTPADSASDRWREGRTESEGFERGSDAAVCGHAATDAYGIAVAGSAGDRTAASGQPQPAVDWGRYGPAIRRWESVLGRTAPPPWQISARTGNRQLSACFTEWMMGLPDGWVTDVPGMTRNGALHVLGNGVVPQQAVYALRLLLQRSALAVAS